MNHGSASMTLPDGARPLLRLIALILAFALGTRALGWLAVPAIGFVWGAVAGRERAAIDSILAATLAWLALLGLQAVTAPVAEVARVLGGVVGVPSWAIFIVTMLFGATLAWSSAVVGREVTRMARADRDAVDDARLVRVRAREPESSGSWPPDTTASAG